MSERRHGLVVCAIVWTTAVSTTTTAFCGGLGQRARPVVTRRDRFGSSVPEWRTARSAQTDGRDALPDDADDDDLDAAFQRRVDGLGGASAVRGRAAASKLKRDAAGAAESLRQRAGESGARIQKALDLRMPERSREPAGTAFEEAQLLNASGWAATVGLLALVVALAVAQSFRIDPSNYT